MLVIGLGSSYARMLWYKFVQWQYTLSQRTTEARELLRCAESPYLIFNIVMRSLLLGFFSVDS